jgi:hypothetical protein
MAQQIRWELGRIAPDRPLSDGEPSFVPEEFRLRTRSTGGCLAQVLKEAR